MRESEKWRIDHYIWTLIIGVGLFSTFLDWPRLPKLVAIAAGAFVVLNHRRIGADLGSWYDRKSKRHPVLYPPHISNQSFQKYFIIFAGIVMMALALLDLTNIF